MHYEKKFVIQTRVIGLELEVVRRRMERAEIIIVPNPDTTQYMTFHDTIQHLGFGVFGNGIRKVQCRSKYH
jgi:hypothetical protein